MRRGMKGSYRRTADLIKEHFTSILLICAAVYVVFLCMSMVQQFFLFIIYGLLGVGLFAIIGGVLLATLGGGLTALGIIIIIFGIVLLFIMLLLFLLFIIAAGAFNFGLQIYIAELLLKLKNGAKVDWSDFWNDLRSGWKRIMKRGAGLFLRYLLIALVISLLTYLILACFVAAFIFMFIFEASPVMTVTTSILANILLMAFYGILMVVVYPVLWFVFEAAAVRMAEGKDAGKAVRQGLRDIRHHKRGVLYFAAGYLMLILATMVFFPLAFILGPIMPVLTKSFFIANRDMFCE
ncbi:MAG: hypothetical protein ACMUHU_07540 [Thermoplasmatota archaeon]